MLMSAITYCSLTGNLSNPDNTFVKYFGNGWKIVWESLPADHYAFIAYDNADQYVLAIRGSSFTFSFKTFENWVLEDFEVSKQVAWQDVLNNSKKIDACHEHTQGETDVPQISKGAARGILHMQTLIDSKGVPLLGFIKENIQKGKSLWVTGHSLGASIATVYSLWLYEKLNPATRPDFSVITFAGPTVGNVSFAKRFDGTFVNNSWRYINMLDIATLVAEKVTSIANFYDSRYVKPASKIRNPLHFRGTLAEEFIRIGKIIEAQEDKCHSHYAHVNDKRTIVLNDKAETYPVKESKSDLDMWFEEALTQHSHDRYLIFLKWGKPGFECVQDKHKP